MGVKLNVPPAVAVVVPATIPSMVMVTVLFASAVPVIGGRGLLVKLLFAGACTTGAEGATESTVKVFVFEGTDVLPAASVEVTATVWLPCVRSAVGVKLKVPPAVAVVVPMTLPSTRIVTVLFASAVPVIGGLTLLVVLPFAGA